MNMNIKIYYLKSRFHKKDSSSCSNKKQVDQCNYLDCFVLVTEKGNNS